ncbi:MAG: flippase-like domain-containing protein [Sphingobacteriaceae bacterium]|nr:flippase-like domain-containing protein [Sphingobacteriaceae bacterium]
MSGKKIISIVIKAFIGIAGVFIIYWKLKDDLTPDNITYLLQAISSQTGLLCLLGCLLLIPINWGIESFKWKLITAQIEKISFKNAQKSVYSGICIGNLAPGRATEFLAKIIFFKPENRTAVSVLHFVNGMFQLSLTYLIGFIGLAIQLNALAHDQVWIAYLSFGIAILVMLVFIISLFKISRIINYAVKKISATKNIEPVNFQFNFSLLFQLFSYSLLRYIVFSVQFILLLYLFAGNFNSNIIIGIVIYFLITTSIPMISFLEGAIRAAVALLVFKNCGISDTAAALASISVWLTNIIIPSIFGYIFLLQQEFDFKLNKRNK